MLTAAGTGVLVLATYGLADNMGNPGLLLMVAVAAVPTAWASIEGLSAQGLLQTDTLLETAQADAKDMFTGVAPALELTRGRHSAVRRGDRPHARVHMHASIRTHQAHRPKPGSTVGAPGAACVGVRCDSVTVSSRCGAVRDGAHLTDPAAAAALTVWDNPVQPLPLFYRSQALLALAVGLLLILLPSAIVESPEPTYTAETLMRRASGAAAAVSSATANWLLLSACQRGRLGASTFRTLNTAICVTNAAVRPRCALPRAHTACPPPPTMSSAVHLHRGLPTSTGDIASGCGRGSARTACLFIIAAVRGRSCGGRSTRRHTTLRPQCVATVRCCVAASANCRELHSVCGTTAAQPASREVVRTNSCCAPAAAPW